MPTTNTHRTEVPIDTCTGKWLVYPGREPILMHRFELRPCPIHKKEG